MIPHIKKFYLLAWVCFMCDIDTMSMIKTLKINQLLQLQPAGTVFLSSILEKKGFSRSLQRKYQTSGWFVSLGAGAMVRCGDVVDWLGGLFSLQQQGLHVHAGGRTALSLSGLAHNLEFGASAVYLFAAQHIICPSWYNRHDWGSSLLWHRTNFLPSDLGLIHLNVKTFSVKISGAPRSMLEYLYAAKHEDDLGEACQIMDGLTMLRPDVVQPLLEQCRSVRVKRLFLWMANRSNHGWLKYIDMSRVDCGSGKRQLVKNGVYIPEFKITVPKVLA